MPDRPIVPGVFARTVSPKMLEGYPNPATGKPRKSAPNCNAPMGGHGAGIKSRVLLIRPDGRPLAFVCEACVEKAAEPYRLESA